jgi:hypothetical protein
MNSSNLLGLPSACTALIATIVGPLVALSVARRQFIAPVVSGNRRRWIENLRNELADIQTIVKLGQAILKREWQRVKLGT